MAKTKDKLIKIVSIRPQGTNEAGLRGQYDPKTKNITCTDGNVMTWNGNDNPWDAPGRVTIEYKDGTKAKTKHHFPAMWAKVGADGKDPPGYGDTPTKAELALDKLLNRYCRLKKPTQKPNTKHKTV